MPDFTTRQLKVQIDTVLAIVHSLSVALDRVEAAQKEQDERIKTIENKVNGQRRTHPSN